MLYFLKESQGSMIDTSYLGAWVERALTEGGHCKPQYPHKCWQGLVVNLSYQCSGDYDRSHRKSWLDRVVEFGTLGSSKRTWLST